MDKTTKFERGMVVALTLCDSERADSPDVMIVDTGKLDPNDADQSIWLTCIEQNFEAGKPAVWPDKGASGITLAPSDYICPDGWTIDFDDDGEKKTLKDAEVNAFPVTIHGTALCFYE